MNNEFRWRFFFSLLAIGNLLNGLWMLASPSHWYYNLPGRVPDFGPMNEHFIRDLGCIFVLMGILSWRASKEIAWRKNTLYILQLWYLPHAAIHLFDTFRGLVAIEHLYMDIPLCYAPPILIGVMQYLLKLENPPKEL